MPPKKAKKDPTKEYDYDYNIARKEEKKKETREEKAKYKLEARNEKIWNKYMFMPSPNLSIRDIAEQQEISLVRAYQIVLDWGGIDKLQQAKDYNEVKDELIQNNISKLEQTTLNLKHDTQPKNTAAKRVLVDIPGLNSEIKEYFGGKKRIRKSMRKSKKSMRKSMRK